MVLKGCVSLAMQQTTLSVSVHHFALSCCRLNVPVIVDCQEDGDGPSVAFSCSFFFPAGKTASDDYALGADACLLYCCF